MPLISRCAIAHAMWRGRACPTPRLAVLLAALALILGHAALALADGNLDWSELVGGTALAGDEAGDSYGAAVSISSDGSRIAVGAAKGDGQAQVNAGHVRCAWAGRRCAAL